MSKWSRLIQIITVSGVSLLAACSATPDFSSSARAYVPRVSIPDANTLNANERATVSIVEDVLVEAGYRPTQGPAEYRLFIDLEDGPVNAHTTLALYQANEELVRSYARIGGPRIILSRSKVIKESFDQCLADFQTRLPRAGSGASFPKQNEVGNWSEVGETERVRPNNAANGVEDWQRGW
jgi:hypothetical protein